MKDARYHPPPALLAKVVDLLDGVPMEDRDTKGDIYKYMLGKVASAGQNCQFCTPRYIIRLIMEMNAPQPIGLLCDPACGTAGLLVAGENPASAPPKHLARREAQGTLPPPYVLRLRLRPHDNTMLRFGSMNMLLPGVENPDIRYRDSLAQDHAGDEALHIRIPRRFHLIDLID